ncbi:MAG TPA: hypothetical protein VNU21_11615 [Usitatibacter sp.]|jgi:hypothetical protein|nr:hypothetical protein [Usitatibacter sp.]
MSRSFPIAFVFATLAAAVLAGAAEGARITSAAEAIDAAKKYVKGRCVPSPPCKYRAQHEGPQWRVWVDLPKKGATPGGHIILFFDLDGNLVRRLEGD